MSPELMFWLMLATKMAVTAVFVTIATTIAERLGAMTGALVATLPVSAGPVYVFLALDHDPSFISSSALASLALNAATAIYVTVYVLIAQRRSMWFSVSLAFATWLAAVFLLSPVHWNVWSAFILNFVAFAVCVFIVQPFCLVPMPPTTRPWYDFGDTGEFGSFACWRGSDFKLPNWSDRERRACCIPGHLYEHHGHSPLPRWRSCHGCGVGECRSRPCWIWRSVVNTASHGSAAWICNSPHRRPRRLRRVECYCLCDTAPPSSASGMSMMRLNRPMSAFVPKQT